MLHQNKKNLEKVQIFIDLSNELISANGELYSTALAFEDLFVRDDPDTPHFDRKTFDELTQLYEAANRLLYEQLSELKAFRTKCSFQALAAEHIAQVKALHQQKKNTSPVQETVVA